MSAPRKIYPKPSEPSAAVQGTASASNGSSSSKPLPSTGPGRANRLHVSKACDRCRVNKTKCDGEQPCRRCKKFDHLCIFRDRKLNMSKLHSRGWVEVLVSHQSVVSKAVHFLYHRCLKGNALKPVPGTTVGDRISVHTIVSYLGYIEEAEKGLCGPDDMAADFLDFLRSLKDDQGTPQTTTELGQHVNLEELIQGMISEGPGGGEETEDLIGADHTEELFQAEDDEELSQGGFPGELAADDETAELAHATTTEELTQDKESAKLLEDEESDSSLSSGADAEGEDDDFQDLMYQSSIFRASRAPSPRPLIFDTANGLGGSVYRGSRQPQASPRGAASRLPMRLQEPDHFQRYYPSQD